MPAVTKGMSASITTAPDASSGTAEMPARTDVFIPRAYSSLITGMQVRPSSSANARSLSCPRTTRTGSSPARPAEATARRSTLMPPRGRKSLLRPIRLEVPAASRTPATRPERSPFMDASRLRAQVPGLAPRVHGEHLRDDADGNLLGTVGAEVESNGRKQLVGLRCPELPEDLVFARARTEQAQIRERLGEQGAQPVPVVLQGVRLDHREVAPPQLERAHAVLGAAEDEARRRGKTLGGEERAAVIHDGHFEARLCRE